MAESSQRLLGDADELLNPEPAEPEEEEEEKDEDQNKATTLTRSKLPGVLRLFSGIQLFTAIGILFLTTSCAALHHLGNQPEFQCHLRGGIWIAMFAIVTASAGMAATRLLSNNSLLTSYFVMCLFASVLSVYLIMVCSFRASEARHYIHLQNDQQRSRILDKRLMMDQPDYYAELSLNMSVASLAFLFGLSSVLSSSFLCAMWGRMKPNSENDPILPTVVYIQTPMEEDEGPSTGRLSLV